MPPARLSVRDVSSLAGGVALASAPFMQWLRIGDVALAGIPDPAGYFVLALGIVAIVVSLVTIVTRHSAPYALLCVGLAGVTTCAVVWRTGPATVADRARARAEAVALVDNVPVQPVPPVAVGAGLVVGMAAAVAIAAAGMSRKTT